MSNFKQWIENLAERITWSISKTGAEPLDRDETDRIGKLLTLELDLHQGNITEEEYEFQVGLIEKGGI